MKEIGNTNYSKLFDFLYECPPRKLNSKDLIRNDYFYYSDLIYKANFKYEDILQNISIYKGILLEPDNISYSKKKKVNIFQRIFSRKIFPLE